MLQGLFGCSSKRSGFCVAYTGCCVACVAHGPCCLQVRGRGVSAVSRAGSVLFHTSHGKACGNSIVQVLCPCEQSHFSQRRLCVCRNLISCKGESVRGKQAGQGQRGCVNMLDGVFGWFDVDVWF